MPGFDYTIAPKPGREVCDFCSSTSVKWAYPCRDFQLMDIWSDPTEEWSQGAWAACDKCYDLIEKGAWNKVIQRALDKYATTGRYPEGTRKATSAALKRFYDRFRSNRTGRPVPHVQGMEVHKDDDGNVQMFSPHGMGPEELESFVSEMGQALNRGHGSLGMDMTQPMPQRPVWANQRSFNKTWDALLRDLPRSSDSIRGMKLNPGMFVSSTGFQGLKDAHLVVVEPETVNAIEDMPLPELWRYGMRTQPRWDSMYLDFEGYAGVCPMVKCAAGEAKLHGAIVMREKRGGLLVVPIGAHDYIAQHIGYGVKVNEDGTVDSALAPRDPAFEFLKYWAVGIGCFGGKVQDGDIKIIDAEGVANGEDLTMITPRGLNRVIEDKEWLHVPNPHSGGIITICANSDVQMLIDKGIDPKQAQSVFERQAFLHGEMVARMCQKVLQTIFFMEHAPVEISPERVSRQVTRNAQRKGHQIGDIVQIRGIRKASNREKGEAQGEYPYSHRFMRCGHFRHLHDEKMLRSRPDLVTPCDRIGEAMCEGGECRKLWIDPVIVGADHPELPLVVKTQVLRRSA